MEEPVVHVVSAAWAPKSREVTLLPVSEWVSAELAVLFDTFC